MSTVETTEGGTDKNAQSSAAGAADYSTPRADREAQKKLGEAQTQTAQKALSVSANLVQLLPTGTVMAYQMLAPSYSNQGDCLPSNWWITLGLVVALTASVVFFAFTDTIIHNKKVYYGVAFPTRLNVINLSRKEENEEFRDIMPELLKKRLKRRDWFHAFLSAVVFLTIASSDVGLQNCFFPRASTDTQQLLRNLPLGMAVFSSLVFTIFPTERNFIRSTDPTADSETESSKKATEDAEKEKAEKAAEERANAEKSKADKGQQTTPANLSTPAADIEAQKKLGEEKTQTAQKALSVSANLVQLLPTGSVMAYQMLAPSFSNQGKCYTYNWWITLGLVVALTASVVFFAFTDSIKHNGKVYYGIASRTRLNVFNLSRKEENEEFRDVMPELLKRRLKRRDWSHALLSAVVFLTMAFSDVGLQKCFFPHAGTNSQQLLKNLPLGMAVFSSLVFTIFPTERNFIGSSDPTGKKANAKKDLLLRGTSVDAGSSR